MWYYYWKENLYSSITTQAQAGCIQPVYVNTVCYYVNKCANVCMFKYQCRETFIVYIPVLKLVGNTTFIKSGSIVLEINMFKQTDW